MNLVYALNSLVSVGFMLFIPEEHMMTVGSLSVEVAEKALVIHFPPSLCSCWLQIPW